MKITLRQIEVFAAIARLENVSRAAVKLNMSQSAASTALLELERHFDCPLFDRIGKSLRLNGSGRGLLPQAEDMLARAGEVEGYLAGGHLAPVAGGATPTIGKYPAALGGGGQRAGGAGWQPGSDEPIGAGAGLVGVDDGAVAVRDGEGDGRVDELALAGGERVEEALVGRLGEGCDGDVEEVGGQRQGGFAGV